MLREFERWIKRMVKGKISITKAVTLTFLLTGSFIVLGAENDAAATTAKTVKVIIKVDDKTEVEGKGEEKDGTLTITIEKDKLDSLTPKTYLHVNGTGTSNLAASSDKGRATEPGSIAIGQGANSVVRDGIAIGTGASVNHDQGTAGRGGIAIGINARSHHLSTAHHEAVVKLKRKAADMTGGIAIGTDTHARISTVDIGNRDYVGKIGDIEFNKKGTLADTWNFTQAVAATTVGDNSVNASNFGTITGAFNIISTTVENGNQFHNLAKGLQGFGSSITGSLNAINGNEKLEGESTDLLNAGAVATGTKAPAKGLVYAGSISHVVGIANTVEKSNGSLIFGAGNKISNSYLTPSGLNAIIDATGKSYINSLIGRFLGGGSEYEGLEIKQLQDSFYKYVQDNRLGSVGIVGGANTANYALLSSITGVGNTLEGTGGKDITTDNTKKEVIKTDAKDKSIFSILNSINGYENKAKNVSSLNLAGSWNEVENAGKSIVFGNNNVLKGTAEEKALGNIVLGFNDEVKQDRIHTSAKNIISIGNNTKVDVDRSIVFGDKSATIKAGETTKGLDEYKNYVFDGKNLTFAGALPVGIFSIGSDTEARRLQNVAAGLISEKSTDAINGSQLYAILEQLKPKSQENKEEPKPTPPDAGGTQPTPPSEKPDQPGGNSNDGKTDPPKEEPKPTPPVGGVADNAGVSTAIAIANLPQIVGKGHNVAAAYGNYKGNHSIAVGLSGTDKSGALVYKASGALSFKGDLSLGIGFGYQFGKQKEEDKIELLEDRVKSLENDRVINAEKFRHLEERNNATEAKLRDLEAKLNRLLSK